MPDPLYELWSLNLRGAEHPVKWKQPAEPAMSNRRTNLLDSTMLASGNKPLLSPVVWREPGQLALESRSDPAFPRNRGRRATAANDSPRRARSALACRLAARSAHPESSGRGADRMIPSREEPATSRPEAAAWPEGPAPYLSQSRAESALRRELDALAAALKPWLQAEHARAADRIGDLHSRPNRLVLRLDHVGVSFSWIPGRLGTVADGRLLVIQWAGVTPQTRGVSSLKSATLVRERTYRAESSGPDSWGWRVDEPDGVACSTTNLAAEWFAGASAEF